MSNFSQSKQNVGSQFNADKIGVTHNVVNNHIPPPIETIKAAWSTASQWFRSMLPETRRYYSSIAQFDANHHRRIEEIKSERLKLAKIDSSRQAYVENRRIQLQEEEIRLQKEKFEWEKSVTQEKFRLIKNSQIIALESKQKELQSAADMHYLHLQCNRDDIIQIFSQDNGKFVVIPSPPEVLRDDQQAFKSLKAEIPPELKRTIEKYDNGITKSVVGYRNIFSAPIGESTASTVGKIIAPIPTLIFHSQVTYQKVIIGITLTCPVVKTVASQTQTSQQQFTMEIHQEHFLLPEWNWMNLKKEFETQGQDHDTSSQAILDLISTIHLIVTLYFCDLYCLNLNPSHRPRLLAFLLESDFPDGLRKWTEPLRSSLVEAQEQIKEELDRIRAVETANLKQVRSDDHGDFSDFFNTPVIASGIGLVFLFAMCSQQPPKLNLTQQEQVYWNNLEKAIDAWDIQTAQRNLTPLRGSQDPCVVKFASTLEANLSPKGAEGFRDVNPIKRYLNEHHNCNFEIIPYEFSP